MSTNRAALISKTHRVLKKHYKPFSPPAERSLFEHILYGCLLQNSAADQADQAFAILLQTYFDWNEVRVTSLNELAERVSCVSDPLHSARRVKISLQNLFEQYYTFNLEEELKNRNQKNLGRSEEHTSELQSQAYLVCRLLLEKKKNYKKWLTHY